MNSRKRILSGFLCFLLILMQFTSAAFALESSHVISVESNVQESMESMESDKDEKNNQAEESDDNTVIGGDSDSLDFNEYTESAVTSAVTPAAINTEHIDWFLNNRDSDTYQIGSAEELKGLAELVNGKARNAEDELVGAVDFDGSTIMLGNSISLEDQEWTPIGDSEKAFKGNFDGNGYIIEGLKIVKTENYAGLFGNTTGTIKNLGVIGNIKSSEDKKGGISGYAGGIIENCF